MTIADWLMISAVVLAPLIAVQVQKSLERWREESERKKQIFKTLMATRATRLDPSHVTALNMIDLEFKETAVLEKWHEYMDFLLDAPINPAGDAPESEQQTYWNDMKIWADKRDDKFIALLYEMSRALKYKFDKVSLKKAIYHPIGFSDLEREQQLLRRAAISFLSGGHSVNMNVTSMPAEGEETKKIQAAIRQYVLELIEGTRTIPLTMAAPEEQKSEAQAQEEENPPAGATTAGK